MNIEKLEQEISEGIRKITIKFSIKKAPVYNLKECLSCYTKDQIFDLAKEHNDYISKSKRKAEMIDDMEEILFKNIENDSLYLKTSEREIMAEISKGKNINELEIEETRRFKKLGYIYHFYHNDEFHIVCPDEIADRYIKAYEKDNEDIVKRNNDMFDNARALQHIYGVFEADQFAVVWNKYNSKKLDKQAVYKFMDIAGRRQNYFWWDQPYIVSDYFLDKDEYEEFLEKSVGRDYYIPTKNELEYYMEEEFDIDNPYYGRMLSYFEKEDSLNEVQLDDLMLSIEVSCTLNESFQDVINVINDSGFKFKDLNELNKFIRNYIDLSNNTRKWELKGYKPVELSEVKPENNVIQLQDHKIAKTNKIGRNQPCPCGSGKKYKFCCGK